MGEEKEFIAALVIQDGIESDKSLGKRYLIQIDSESGRMFVDATNLVLRVLDGSLPKFGEFYLDGNCTIEELREAQKRYTIK